VLVPHVVSASDARETAAACRYRGGRRGFSNSTRAGRFGGLALAEHVETQDRQVAVIAAIEDPEALDNIEAIVAVDGIDGLFIGRGDLAVALGRTSIEAREVQEAVERVMAAARRGGKPVCMMVNGAAEAGPFRAMGATAFIVSTDQAFLRAAASRALNEMRVLPDRSTAATE
jgi:2-keto-3-deoxy-L-rhamnonate aldolase RhmA